MTVEQICALPVGDLAAKDCALFLWITDPFREHARKVFKAWGFTYSTRGFVWIKPKPGCLSDVPDITAEEMWEQGTGYTTRANPEDCLLARRGRLQRKARDVSRVIVAPKREHSRKPEEVYRRIERLVSGPYCELFARRRREGWDSATIRAMPGALRLRLHRRRKRDDITIGSRRPEFPKPLRDKMIESGLITESKARDPVALVEALEKMAGGDVVGQALRPVDLDRQSWRPSTGSSTI